MTRALGATIIVGLGLVGLAMEAGLDDARADESRLARFHEAARALVLKRFPEAKAEADGDRLRYAHATRTFQVHLPLKTGEWQDAVAMTGPKKGGILIEIELREGRWEGAAVVPQSFDHHYFDVLLLAPYAKSHDRHLVVRIATPRLGADAELVEAFTKLANDFAAHLPPPSPEGPR